MIYDSMQTSIGSNEKTTQLATSAVASDTVVNYKFGETSIKFTDISVADSETISQETEDNFYKKAFETKSLQ